MKSSSQEIWQETCTLVDVRDLTEQGILGGAMRSGGHKRHKMAGYNGHR